MEEPFGEEETGSAIRTRSRGSGSVKAYSLGRETEAQSGAAPSGIPQAQEQPFGAGKPDQVPRAGPRTEGRAELTHHGGRSGPFQAAGGRFAAGPWLGHHLGEGGREHKRWRLQSWLRSA